MSKRRILIVVAMEAEAAPLRDAYGLRPVEPSPLAPLPATVVTGTTVHAELVVATSGHAPLPAGQVASVLDLIGSIPAALTLQRALEVLRPDLVLNIGCCGGYERCGAAIGDVYVASAAYLHDRRVPNVPGFEGWHRYFQRNFLAFDASPVAAALGLEMAAVSTGDSFAASTEDEERIRASGAALKEMEAGAYAWTAALYRTPLVILKAVTDIVDHTHRPNDQDFLANLRLASEHLRTQAMAFIEYAASRPIEEIGRFVET
ncbi:MAG: hypothetical protein KDA22_10000 [Phycisphaerales bacterium]|nr:hypothetical protein [Phycisphaerales bacterium]